MKKIKSISDLKKWREEILSEQKHDDVVISVCGGTGCHAYGCKRVRDQFAKALKTTGNGKKIRLRYTGCRGFCERGPIVTIQPQGIFYQKVQEKDVPSILSETVKNGKILEHLLYEDSKTKRKVTSSRKSPFIRRSAGLSWKIMATSNRRGWRTTLAWAGTRPWQKPSLT